MAVSAAEQYLMELINRARLDPQAEAARYGLSLNAGLAAGTITGEARQVLAPNTRLESAAIDHSQWMLDTNTFAHEGIDGSSPGDRIQDAGYDLIGRWSWRENLAWSGTTQTLDLAAAVDTHHEGLYRSAGHRVNTFADEIREVGIAQIAGQFTHDGVTYNASMVTLNYASSGNAHFVTGVAYQDTDGDDFYSIGEGTAGLTVLADGARATTASAGGYGVAVTPDDTVAVTILSGSTVLAELTVDAMSGNVKVDVVTYTDGSQALALSGSATLVSGIADATLLGVADLSLTGSALDNTLNGNAGRNRLDGAGGDDVLTGAKGSDVLIGGTGDDILRGGQGRDIRWDSLDRVGTASSVNADQLNGGAGDDRLHGQSGQDYLDGGAGDDRMSGGGGRDVFVFNDGDDRILDFTDNVDQIEIDAAALGLASAVTVADLVADASVQGGDALFDFGNGDRLRINDIDFLDVLLNDLVII